MPAPKLLDKRMVNAIAATEQKQQIEKGIELAKKVDAVREALGNEERELDEFRQKTMATVQAEINAKIFERDTLERSNALLREERMRLSAPIDLSQAWKEVNDQKEDIAAWKEILTQRDIQTLAEAEDNRQKKEELDRHKQEIDRAANLAQQTLSTVELKYAQADDLLNQNRRDVEESNRLCAQRENHLKVREEEATDREIILSERERQVDAHEIDLSNREKKLRSRQELFLKAQSYINSKKKL